MGSKNKIDLTLGVRKKKNNKKINQTLLLLTLFLLSFTAFTIFFTTNQQDPVETLSGAHASAKPGCMGDVNGDSRVDEADRNQVARYFGETCGQGTCRGADLNIDSKVDENDFKLLYENWGETC
ncbi:MAG: hypothetical protein GF334_12135 [Candidatus Altiarchaeales archaeon]|nr:hypothetical protein [Candidatus Altiarchaeales archaeon]